MGLQSQLGDASSESFLIVVVVHIGKSARYLHSLIFTILHALGIYSFNPEQPPNFEDTLYGMVGSRLAGIILMCEQLNSSYPNYRSDSEDCVVCLNRVGEGDLVRKLVCCHVFHKECVDEWLELNLSCPLCRAHLVEEAKQQNLARDLIDWFQFQ